MAPCGGGYPWGITLTDSESARTKGRVRGVRIRPFGAMGVAGELMPGKEAEEVLLLFYGFFIQIERERLAG